MNKYQIRPLKTGTIIVAKGAYITRGVDLGKEVDIPATAWYLTDGHHKIMVDIGMCHTTLADWHHHGSWQEPGEAVHERLQAIAVDPAEIEVIIFTYLHWDHCHNLDQFPNARFLVNAREYEFALDPIPPYYKSYEHPKEVHVHLAIFQVRSDVHGIVHYHAPFATAYAVRGLPLPLPTVHARRILKEVPLIAEYPEGSPELAVARACEDVEVVGLLMANHGLMAVGSNLQQSQYRAELMEESARIGWLSQDIH